MHQSGSLRRAWPIIAALLLALSACATTKTYDATKDWSAAKFYAEARRSLHQGNYEQSIKYYETLESRYPFGRYAQQAELEVAYAYYKYNEPDSAIAAANRFIKINPLHPYVDYAMYIKGLANFNRGVSVLDRLSKEPYSKRDPQSAREAYRDFAELVKKFPNSRYAADARKRMAYLRDNLAEYELNVAGYYMKRQAYVAAANRAKYVLENYQRTPAVPDALVVMVRAYQALGLHGLAEDARRVLTLNYPEKAAELARSQQNDGATQQ